MASNESARKHPVFKPPTLLKSLAKEALKATRTIEDLFSPYVPLINLIDGLVTEIVNACKAVKKHRRLCNDLEDRVMIAHWAIKRLEKNKEENRKNLCDDGFKLAFDRFCEVLQQIKRYILAISKYSVIENIIHSCDLYDQYKKLIDEFEKVCFDLNFSIVIMVFQSINEKNQERILTEMNEMKEEILNTNMLTMMKLNTIYAAVVKKKLDCDLEIKMDPIKNNELEVPKKRKKSDNRKGVEKMVLRKVVNVACKEFYQNSKSEKRVKMVLKIMSEIQCDYIVRFYGWSSVKRKKVLVFEWAEIGDLKNFYETCHINWPMKLRIALDVCKGLNYMHNTNILHHDVRCKNILIDNEGKAKITNFKLSRFADQDSVHAKTIENYPWLAPEKMENMIECRYDEGCEMFSYGMFLWELIYQKRPYRDLNDKDICEHVISHKREEIKIGQENFEIQQELITVIKEAWTHAPEYRPYFSEVKRKLEKIWSKTHENFTPSFSPISLNDHNKTDPDEIVLNEKLLSPFNSIMSYEIGREAHVNKDYEKAWKCFCDNAEYCNMKAVYMKGIYLYKGIYVTKDQDEGIKLIKAAADGGIGEAQYYYTLIVKKRKSYEEFKKYLMMAVKNSNADAMILLGKMYLEGEYPFEKNESDGYYYIARAAQLSST